MAIQPNTGLSSETVEFPRFTAVETGTDLRVIDYTQ